jgi:hypothetical protein
VCAVFGYLKKGLPGHKWRDEVHEGKARQHVPVLLQFHLVFPNGTTQVLDQNAEPRCILKGINNKSINHGTSVIHLSVSAAF